jgi:hypothetical protein
LVDGGQPRIQSRTLVPTVSWLVIGCDRRQRRHLHAGGLRRREAPRPRNLARGGDARVFVFPRAPFMVGGATMTQDDLDDGRLVCLVGVPSSRPAEFVIFRDLFPNNPAQ